MDNKFPIQHDYNILYHMRSDTYTHWETNKHRIKPTDIIIATDSSRAIGLTGIGIYIKDYDKQYSECSALV